MPKNRVFIHISSLSTLCLVLLACSQPLNVSVNIGQQNASDIRKLKASLIVQGANCILCHATINSNFVTDFGATNPNPNFQALINSGGIPQYAATGVPFFGLGGDESSTTPKLATSTANTLTTGGYNFRTPYNNANWGWDAPTGWSASSSTAAPPQINGTVIVPQVQIPTTQLSSMFPGTASSGTMSWGQIFSLPDPESHNGITQSLTMVSSIHPQPQSGGAINPPLVQAASLQIQYPTAQSIAPFASVVDANAGKFGTVQVSNGSYSLVTLPAGTFSGLISMTGSSGTYVTNDPSNPFNCYGDVVVDAPLLLNNLNLQTDTNGCRIYSSHSVFIQGPITYGVNASTANLQIASALGIFMGFNLSTLTYRLLNYSAQTDPLNLGKGIATSLSASTVQPANSDFALILGDASVVGSALVDTSYQETHAQGISTGGNNTIQDAADSIPYSGLLLAAPYVHSRYYGNFMGVIEADIAIGQLGNFSFSYDPRFDNTPQILPLLPTPLLTVSADAAVALGTSGD